MRWKRLLGVLWLPGGLAAYSLARSWMPGLGGALTLSVSTLLPCSLVILYAAGVRLFPRLWTAFALRWTGAAVCWLVAFCLLVNGVTQPGIDSSPAAFAFAVYTVSRPDWSYGADTFSSWTLCLLPPAYLGESASLASSRPPTA